MTNYRFVCATSKQTGKTVVFSSYPSDRRGRDLLDTATIWQVARATSAATSFFDPIEIGHEEFVDGATPANNPITELWSEAYDVFSGGKSTWDLEQNISCIVSIGTGVPTIRPFGDDPLRIGAKLIKIATDTEKTAEDFSRHHPRLCMEKRYFRFNVRKGLETVGLEEETKYREIISSTRLYLQAEEVHRLMTACAHAMSKQRDLTRNYMFALEQSGRPEIQALQKNSDILGTIFNITPSSDIVAWFTNTHGYLSWVSGGGGCLYYPISSSTTQGMGKYLVGAIPALWRRYPPGTSGSSNNPNVWTVFSGCENIANGGVADVVRLLVVQMLAKMCPTENDWNAIHQRVTLEERRLLATDLRKGSLASLFNFLGFLVATKRGPGSEVKHAPSTRVLCIITNVQLLRAGFIERDMTQFRSEVERMGVYVLLTGKESLSMDNLSWGAKSFPRVDEETEYREFLSSLEFDNMHTRRNQVAVAFSGTTEWISSHSAFEDWSEEPSGILWIQGKPGSGKSVLAKSILNRVRQSAPQNLLMASWFYSKRGGDMGMSHTSMMRSICYQLLSQSKELFKACASIYRRETQNFLPALPEVLAAIFSAQNSPQILCLLDGLDESADRDEKGGRAMLQLFAELTELPGSKLKVIVLSRPYSSIEEAYGTYDILLEAENGSDIAKIVDRGIATLSEAMDRGRPEAVSSFASKRRQKLGLTLRTMSKAERPPSGRADETTLQQEMSSIKTYLISHAQGVTLWVTLAIDQAVRYTNKGPCNWAIVRKMLASLPLEINQMYNLITTELTQDCNAEHIRMARKVLAWVITASTKRPLLVKELFDALAIPDSLGNSNDVWPSTRDPVTSNRPICESWPDFCRSIFDICGPLVEFVNPPSQRGHGSFQYDRMTNVTGRSVVQLVHQTAKDFLESIQDNLFAFQPGEAACVMNTGADTYLRLVIPLQNMTYAPVLDDISSAWTKTVEDLVEYLDDKFLLPFILSHCPVPDEYREMVTSQTHSRWMLSAFFYEMSYIDINVGGVLERTVVGACFILACKRGLQTAVDNLLYLTSLSPLWWRTHRHAVLTAAQRVAESQELGALARELGEDRRHMLITPAIRHDQVDSLQALLQHSSNRDSRPKTIVGWDDVPGYSHREPRSQNTTGEGPLFPDVEAGPREQVREAIERIVHYLTGNMQPFDLRAGVTWEMESSGRRTGSGSSASGSSRQSRGDGSLGGFTLRGSGGSGASSTTTVGLDGGSGGEWGGWDGDIF